MADARNPTVRRRELGVLLRTLRTERGWTVEYVADRLLCSPSKVSRMETGHRGASARDIRDLSELYGVSDEQRDRMLALATEGKQRAWWQPLNLPYSTYIGLEAEARSISDYGLHVLPGLLQTADYARAVVRAVAPDLSPEVVEQRVRGRIERQQILRSDSRPDFSAVVDESVLHRLVGSPEVMVVQLERVREASLLPNVSFRIIPFAAGVPPAINTKFILLNFANPAIHDVVFVEGLTGDAYFDDPDDVQAYMRTFAALSDVAAGPVETREIIDQKIAAYARCSR
jgi:transcriptional regulator with XRE-family HTH domain